ncbi:MAG: ORF6N domain-containing protein [Bacteroidales bacterium]|nr:ORF6N domain-containing protein [Bacteroidales bacterium]
MEQLDHIQNLIYIIRGQRVMLDYDLARIYQVETKSLNQAVKRNIKRFEGEEFMFQLSKEEWNAIKTEIKKLYDINNQDITVLRSQFVTAKSVQKQRFQPYAFTEIGVAMLSSVLRSEVAIYANRRIMKAFVSYRHMTEMPLAATYLELRKQIEDLRAEVNEILADQTRAACDARLRPCSYLSSGDRTTEASGSAQH